MYGTLSPKDSYKFYRSRGELDDVLGSAGRGLQNSKLAQLADAEISRELKPLIHSRKLMKTPLRDDEVASIANTAIGEASAQDRANTPQKDWYLKLWRDFEQGRPASIIERVRRDIVDQLRHEWREVNVARRPSRHVMREILKGNPPRALVVAGEQIQPGVCRAKGSETAKDRTICVSGLLRSLRWLPSKNKSPGNSQKQKMIVMKDQVCKTPEEHVIWQAKIEDPDSDLDQLQGRVYSETGKDLTVQRIWQISSRLQKQANRIKPSR